MAPSTKYFTFLFLIFLAFSLQVEARESHFFSKATRYDTQNKTVQVEKNEPTTVTPQSHNGYGLYGHESERVKDQFSAPPEEYPDVKSYENKQSTAGYLNDEYYNKQNTEGYLNNEYYNKQNTAGYGNNEYNNKQSTAGYLNNEYYNKQNTAGYDNSKYDNKQYGMSDTRFLEKGRYYYDVNKKNNYYQNEYKQPETTPERYNTAGRGGYNRTPGPPTERYNTPENAYEKSGGYYGSNENAYEYNGSNKGYQNKEENEEYMP
ncbi:uncharacterized protein LOC143845664 [Tasmannia lanceolata]|uniref:uncharacterized protein LOC143845664 n=1 Tax=Tasmannia lanceolata TaxID=3420 RepID=UPI004063C685